MRSNEFGILANAVVTRRSVATAQPIAASRVALQAKGVMRPPPKEPTIKEEHWGN
jgi:hypothetical protein